MQLKDLRIGNLIKTVKGNGGGHLPYWQITSEDFATMLVKDDIGVFKEIYEPVILTEDLLLKTGFERRKVIERSYRGKYACFIKDNVFGNFFYEENCLEYNLGKKQTKYKFFHELQNLYFAIEQTELEL